MGAELVIGIGKGKPPKDASKDDAMGGEPEPDKEPASEKLDGFDASLDDAYDAVERKDRGAFKEALGAAIAAKCAEMYGEEE